MAITVHNDGEWRRVTPNLHSLGAWRSISVWIYSNGTWTQSYDPNEENLISNSRLLNGTDYFTYTDGSTSGYTPPGWTMYTEPETQGNAWATFSYNDLEYSRSYTFRVEGSRLFMQGRIYCEKDATYTASAVVDRLVLGSTPRKVFDVWADKVLSSGQKDYIEIITPFPNSEDIIVGERVECVFRMKQDSIVQMNMGIGVDYQDRGEIQVSKPQVSRSSSMLPYVPTPRDVNYNAVELISSYFSLDKDIVTKVGAHYLEASIVLNTEYTDMLIFGRQNGTGNPSGIGIREENGNKYLTVYDHNTNASGGVVADSILIKDIPVGSIVGIGLHFELESNGVKNIRFQLNGETIAHIPEQTFWTGNIDSVFGSDDSVNESITVEQFNLKSDDVQMCFNLEEAQGSVITSGCGDITGEIQGLEGIDFNWIKAVFPLITLHPNSFSTNYGDTVTIRAEGLNYDSIQWFLNNEEIDGANSEDYSFVIDPLYDFDSSYHAEFKNRFGVANTNASYITLAGGNEITVTTESGDTLIDESGTFDIVSEFELPPVLLENGNTLIEENGLPVIREQIGVVNQPIHLEIEPLGGGFNTMNVEVDDDPVVEESTTYV